MGVTALKIKLSKTVKIHLGMTAQLVSNVEGEELEEEF